ncbi:hypothetical protein LV457_07395 [Mycobacterium sp. MYCO198283]|uniref:hypothetical protein n=1 Tax=Mycobacterium sp. MYCO198283 TaxID=2883505 RepID=UPI001E3788AA|nr:hypothetical protein [Mycobacterium sp. MYCO198283]MCG5432115.1 hypothetical protein [Mycobacterium sp. MYCO198283]
MSIETPHGRNYKVAANEVFDADEANELFMSYYLTGTIPDAYALRPIRAWKADGTEVYFD